VAGQRHDAALGAAADRAGQVQERSERRAAGKDENAAWHISNVGRRYLYDHDV
jgi:hypothetical protein